MNPSGLEWWAWLIVSVAAFFVGEVFRRAAHACLKDKNTLAVTVGIFAWTIAWTALSAGCFSAIIGIIRFVKWVWEA